MVSKEKEFCLFNFVKYSEILDFVGGKLRKSLE